MASTDAKPIPQKNVAYRVTFPIFDADGDLVTGATGLDSEVSKDGAAFADCTNEATEIATSSGIYYLDLTSTEMNADTVAVIIKTSSSGAKTTPIIMYPEEAGDIRVNATQWNSLTTVALPLVPTVAGRTLDVSAGGEAGLDWANIGSPTTAVNLSGTNIDVDQVVASVSGAVGSVTGNVGGNVTGSVGTVNALAANVITAAATASDFGTEIGTAVWATTTRILTAGTNIALAKGTGVTGFTDIDAAGVRTAVGLASANLDTQLAALPTDADVSAAVWNASTASYGTAGTYGLLIETNLDAAITSRMATYTQPTGFLAATFPTGTIANTTNITAGTITTATNVTTVNGLAADTITSTALAASAVTEIQSGLSTLDAAGVRTAIGLASANLDTQLGAIPTAIENADELLTRDWTSVSVAGTTRCVLTALYPLRNKVDVPNGSVYESDDTTVAWLFTTTTDVAAEPITVVDPT